MDTTRPLKLCCGILHQDVSSRTFRSCKLWGGASMDQTCLSSISHRWSTRLRSGQFGGQVNTLNSSLCSSNHSWTILALWQGSLSCWKSHPPTHTHTHTAFTLANFPGVGLLLVCCIKDKEPERRGSERGMLVETGWCLCEKPQTACRCCITRSSLFLHCWFCKARSYVKAHVLADCSHKPLFSMNEWMRLIVGCSFRFIARPLYKSGCSVRSRAHFCWCCFERLNWSLTHCQQLAAWSSL